MSVEDIFFQQTKLETEKNGNKFEITSVLLEVLKDQIESNFHFYILCLIYYSFIYIYIMNILL